MFCDVSLERVLNMVEGDVTMEIFALFFLCCSVSVAVIVAHIIIVLQTTRSTKARVVPLPARPFACRGSHPLNSITTLPAASGLAIGSSLAYPYLPSTCTITGHNHCLTRGCLEPAALSCAAAAAAWRPACASQPLARSCRCLYTPTPPLQRFTPPG